MKEIRILYKKTRVFFATILSLIVLCSSFWCSFEYYNYLIGLNSLRLILGFIIINLMIFFFFLFMVYMLFSSHSDLVLSDKGIFDQSNKFGVGFIKWKDIQEIRTDKSFSNEIMLLFVKEPESFMNAAKSKLQLKLLQKNQAYFGTCFIINIALFRYDKKQLKNLIQSMFVKYGT